MSGEMKKRQSLFVSHERDESAYLRIISGYINNIYHNVVDFKPK